MFSKIQHKTIFGSKAPMYNNGSLLIAKIKDNTITKNKINKLN